MTKYKGNIHTHPEMERKLGVDPGHVIVDFDEFEGIKEEYSKLKEIAGEAARLSLLALGTQEWVDSFNVMMGLLEDLGGS